MTHPVSAHSEYPEHLRTFQRQQSRALREMEWEDRKRVWRLWRGDVAVALAVILLGLLAFPTAEIVADLWAGW